MSRNRNSWIMTIYSWCFSEGETGVRGPKGNTGPSGPPGPSGMLYW